MCKIAGTSNCSSINSIQRCLFFDAEWFCATVHVTGPSMNTRSYVRTCIPPKQISGSAGTGNPSEICRCSLLSQQKLGRGPARVHVSAVGWAACRVVDRPNRLVTQFVVASVSSNQLSSSYRCVLKHSQFIIYPLFMFILDFSIIHFLFSNFWLFLKATTPLFVSI